MTIKVTGKLQDGTVFMQHDELKFIADDGQVGAIAEYSFINNYVG